ncbi:MAG: bifunctional diguanylate cyclase/phosphodiesterase [Bauldia sp.]
MPKAITGRITLNLIAGIVITVATVGITISWMAQKHNEQAARSTETMVVGGLKSMGRRLAQLANDYGWWEEAYDAYLRTDAEWIEANIGTGITDTAIADLLVIVSPEGKIDYGWLTEETDDTIDDIVTPKILAKVQAIADRLEVDNFAGVSGLYFDTQSDPMMIAVSHVAPVSRAEETEAHDLPIIVFAQYLDDDRLSELGKGYLIDDLHFIRAADEPTDELTIADLAGTPLGHFAWTPPKPGDALLRSALAPIAIALFLFCVVALTTAFRARKIAIALGDSEKEAVIAARTDSMTGLMNRTGFLERIESEGYTEACRHGELAVIYLDINGFKTVNDSIGHNGGDELVKALALRVTSVLPPAAVFARIGGDEFAVAVDGPDASAAAATTASHIVHSLDDPFTIHGFEFHVTASVGYAVADDPVVTTVEIVRRADLAMYQAKNGAEREPIAYHPTMETGALEKKQIEAGLRRAIENEEFKVFYQPIVRAADLRIVALEALVRWTSHEFGNVSPGLFIPVAEETGLIHDVGRLVVHRACADLKRWPGLKMALNISPVQLRDPNFADDLVTIVRGYDLDPGQFELELTEGILVTNPTIAKRKLAMLKDFGFSLALDDFGTGFSSIGYLRQFPFDILKVDRSFVRDIGMSTTANALIQSLVSLGDALDLSVIAEGIENEEQLRLLRLVQCEFVQGFLISRPLPAEGIDALLASLDGEAHRRAGQTPAAAVAGAA